MFNPACRAIKIDRALHRSSAPNQQRFFRPLPCRNDGKSTAHCREKREQENHARVPSRSAALMSSCTHSKSTPAGSAHGDNGVTATTPAICVVPGLPRLIRWHCSYGARNGLRFAAAALTRQSFCLAAGVRIKRNV